MNVSLYEVDFASFTDLNARLRNLGKDAEKAINDVLKTEGANILVPEITKLIPISKKKEGKHARNSDWSKAMFGSLEITIKTAGGAANKPGSWGYLVFPNEGRGPSNFFAWEFFEGGAAKASTKLISTTEEKLIRLLEEDI